MGDWNGWSAYVCVDEVEVQILCWPFFHLADHWLFQLKPNPKMGLFKRHTEKAMHDAQYKVAAAMDKIAQEIPGESVARWFADNPWDDLQFEALEW